MEKELVLFVDTAPDGTFDVYSKVVPLEVTLMGSVIIVDYKYTPWPRYEGNLLWQ